MTPKVRPSDPPGCSLVFNKSKGKQFHFVIILSTQCSKNIYSSAVFGAISHRFKVGRKEWESKKWDSDGENKSRPLCVWISLQISMDNRSTTSPSTIKHSAGCALIVLLTLIVIKGLKTAARLWVIPCAKVASHLFIGDITALPATNAQVTVKSDRLTTVRDGFIWGSPAPLTTHFTLMTSSAFSIVPIKFSVCLRTSH